MALKGTIQDFGVADIFQLIGHQSKTGVLLLSDGQDEVRAYFKNGGIVRAERVDQPIERLLGEMLLRAGMLTEEKLSYALRDQERTLKRLGAVLIDLGYLTPNDVSEFATLQLKETLYDLFLWNEGTYEFDAVPVEILMRGVGPIEVQAICMEGLRILDEWPQIRRRIPSNDCTVERLRPLPEKPSDVIEDEFAAMDAIDPIDSAGRTVYGLALPNVFVQEIIYQSRLGEFETCHALNSLAEAGYLRVYPPRDNAPQPIPTKRIHPFGAVPSAWSLVGKMLTTAVLVLVGVVLAFQLPWARSLSAAPTSVAFQAGVLDRYASRGQLQVLRRALELYRLETGAYPDRLEQLVGLGLARRSDLQFPYRRPYYYEVSEGQVILLPPLY